VARDRTFRLTLRNGEHVCDHVTAAPTWRRGDELYSGERRRFYRVLEIDVNVNHGIEAIFVVEPVELGVLE
jgi:hypothetical protein